MTTEPFEGHPNRECGEHRTTGQRAWCYADSEWCYPDIGEACRGCRIPVLEARATAIPDGPAGLRDRIDTALQVSADRCARCKACDVQVDAVIAAIGPELALTRTSRWRTQTRLT